MPFMYSGNILVVHLDQGHCEDMFLDDDLVEDRVGGALLGLGLYREHADGDPIVLAAGPLTGSLVPTASAVALTARSPLTGGVVHCSVTSHAGPELKYTGYDAIVVRGTSPEPVYLWVHDEQAELLPAGELWGADAYEVTDAVRQRQGDERVQVLVAGPAAANGSLASAITLNYWASTDRGAVGALMGSKRLLALAARGMGELEPADIDGFGPAALRLLGHVRGHRPPEGFRWDRGLLDPARRAVESLLHRHRACFYCNSRGMPYIMLDEDPGLMAESRLTAPGVHVSEVLPLLDLHAAGMDGRAMGEATRRAYRMGLDPGRTARALREAGAAGLEEAVTVMDRLARGEGAPPPGSPMLGWDLGDGTGGHDAFAALGAFTTANAPLLPAEGVDGAEELLLRQGLAYVLGMCPAGAVGAGIDALAVEEVTEAATGLGLTADDLVSLSRRLVAETLRLGPGASREATGAEAELRRRFD